MKNKNSEYPNFLLIKNRITTVNYKQTNAFVVKKAEPKEQSPQEKLSKRIPFPPTERTSDELQ